MIPSILPSPLFTKNGDPMRCILALAVGLLSALCLTGCGKSNSGEDAEASRLQESVAAEIAAMSAELAKFPKAGKSVPPSMSNDAQRWKSDFVNFIYNRWGEQGSQGNPEDFELVNAKIQTGGLGLGYNYKNRAGTLAALDLYTLDQAEALVFWLGGFPTPYDPQRFAPIVLSSTLGS